MKTAILLDIENMQGAATKDKDARLDPYQTIEWFGRNAIAYAEKELGGQYVAYAALGLPLSPRRMTPPPTRFMRERIQRSRKDRKDWAGVLTDLGYTMALMQDGPDAADTALVEAAERLAPQSDISAVVLCTQDGGAPFQKIIELFRSEGKAVYLMSYDRVPRAIERRVAHAFTVGDLLRAFVDEKRRTPSPANAASRNGAQHPAAPAPRPKAEPPKPAVKRTHAEKSPGEARSSFNQAARAIKRGTADVASLYVQAILRATRILADYCWRGHAVGRPHFLHHQIVEELKKGLPQFISGEELFDDDVRYIADAIVKHTDFFELLEMHEPRKKSAFWQNVQALEQRIQQEAGAERPH